MPDNPTTALWELLNQLGKVETDKAGLQNKIDQLAAARSQGEVSDPDPLGWNGAPDFESAEFDSRSGEEISRRIDELANAANYDLISADRRTLLQGREDDGIRSLYKELEGKGIRWRVTVLEVEHYGDGRLIRVKSQLAQGGQLRNWFFDAKANHEALLQVRRLDQITATGVVVESGDLVKAKVLDVHPAAEDGR